VSIFIFHLKIRGVYELSGHTSYVDLFNEIKDIVFEDDIITYNNN